MKLHWKLIGACVFWLLASLLISMVVGLPFMVISSMCLIMMICAIVDTHYDKIKENEQKVKREANIIKYREEQKAEVITKALREKERTLQNPRYIPKAIQREVWRRDYGKCVECGSQERLEYDHIIPFSKGGSNTVRNIQLLCEKCNRKKQNKI